MAEMTSQDMAGKLLAAGFERSGPSATALSDPIADTPMVVTLDQLRPYDHDPRKKRNPAYEEIKASIRERGLDAAPAITRRPGEDHYIIRNGGNTRLAILRELWSETRDERFFRISCLFRPWPARGEIVALTGHLAENELRGGLTFIERALGVGLIPTFRNRLYWVDFTGATDVSAIPNLDAGGFQPVGKRLLWERNMGIIPSRNFEGLALGSALPQLGPTSHSVLLIADNGGGTNQHLYALILHGLEIARTPLEHWRQQHWGTILNEDAAANAADPDGDRWPNLFEYAFGRNPRQAGPTPPVTPLGSAEQAGLSYVLTNSATDVIVWMEQNPVGPHTDAWTTAGIHETRVTNGNQIHVTAWVTNPPPATAGDLFLRLRAHVP